MWNNVSQRTAYMLEQFWFKNWNEWDRYSKRIWIKTEFAVCKAWAETDLGKQLKTNNIFNVWNTDSWATMWFKDLEDMFHWLWEKVLNNEWMKDKKTLADLVPFDNRGKCEVKCDKAYATSPENWWSNVTNCLSNIYQERLDLSFKFRR